MLTLNQLTGFAAFRHPELKARHVGQYALNYGGTATGTATVPSADMQYAPSPTRQLAVVWRGEVPLANQCTINGRFAPCCVQDGSRFINIYGAYNPDAGDATVAVTIAAADDEVGRVDVFEVEYAHPLHESLRSPQTQISGNTVSYRITVPPGGVVLAGAICTNDGGTFTWSGLTEINDADAGDYRASTAADLTPATAVERLDNTVATTASTNVMSMIAPGPIDLLGVRGGFHSRFGLAHASSQCGVPDLQRNYTDFTGLGNFKLVLAYYNQTGNVPTGITVGGEAATKLGEIRNTGPATPLVISVWAIDVFNGEPDGEIVVTLDGTPGQACFFGQFRLYGVGEVGTVQSATQNGTGPSLSVDVKQGGAILAFHIRDDDTQTISTNTGVAEVYDFAGGAPGFRAHASAYWLSEADETGRTVQIIGSSSGQCATLAIPFNP
jgi:hypothetical protein